MIRTYRKIATIEAEQFDESDEQVKKYGLITPIKGWGDIYHYLLPTKEGDMLLSIGDWIATGVQGEHWVIKDDIFKKTYTEADK